MSQDSLKLTTYFGERDRADGTFLASALMDLYGRRSFKTSVLLRGVEGFGVKHHLQTARLLTLSEDLPIVSVAVDSRERVRAALDDVTRLTSHGLVTLERARLVSGAGDLDAPLAGEHEATKLTVYIGRQQRLGGRPAYLSTVDLLRDCGVDGATVLLGVDGTVHGTRQRARFFGANPEVPLMIIAIGRPEQIGEAVTQLGERLAQPLMTLERVRLCKRDGTQLAEPRHLPETDPSGLGVWQKLMVYSGEQSRHRGRPLQHELIRKLREAGAAGATTLRGIWGYHGDHRPHGDVVWAIRRRVPLVTVIVDTPTRIRRWFEIVDELTDETGLVTSEMVPAFHATGPDVERGGLRLARPLP